MNRSDEYSMSREMFLAPYSDLRSAETEESKYQAIEQGIERLYGWRDGAWYYIELHRMHFMARRV